MASKSQAAGTSLSSLLSSKPITRAKRAPRKRREGGQPGLVGTGGRHAFVLVVDAHRHGQRLLRAPRPVERRGAPRDRYTSKTSGGGGGGTMCGVHCNLSGVYCDMHVLCRRHACVHGMLTGRHPEDSEVLEEKKKTASRSKLPSDLNGHAQSGNWVRHGANCRLPTTNVQGTANRIWDPLCPRVMTRVKRPSRPFANVAEHGQQILKTPFCNYFRDNIFENSDKHFPRKNS